MSGASKHPVVIGVGNAWAGDDAAGLLVARMVRGRVPAGVEVVEHEGEPTALLDVWDGAGLVVLVDATSGGAEPGAVRVFDASREKLPAGFTGTSTHAFSLAQAIELGRALGRLPEELVIVGVEGASFEAGTPPAAPVTAGVEQAAARVLALVASPAART
jgi:hydrogenase maturation protease